VAQRTFGDEAWVLPFGSVVQGVHLQHSDLDLCVHVPGVGGPHPSRHFDNGQQVAALRKIMYNLTHDFEVVETRLFRTIKVPIILLRYASRTGRVIELDISIGIQCDGVQKGSVDRLVRRLLAGAPAALPLVRLVKQWAKVEGLTEAFAGFLNSLGWTLLVLYWLIRRGDVRADAICGLDVDVLRVDRSHSLPAPLRGSLSQAPSVAVLADFFLSVANYETFLDDDEYSGGAAWGVSLVDCESMQGPGTDTAPFFLEDPGVRLISGRVQNIARALRHREWRTILKKCRATGRMLGGEGACAERWAVSLLARSARGICRTEPLIRVDPWPREGSPEADAAAAASEGRSGRPSGKRSLRLEGQAGTVADAEAVRRAAKRNRRASLAEVQPTLVAVVAPAAAAAADDAAADAGVARKVRKVRKTTAAGRVQRSGRATKEKRAASASGGEAWRWKS